MGFSVQPCPACAKDAILHHTSYRVWLIQCASCELEGAGMDAETARTALRNQAAARETQIIEPVAGKPDAIT